MLWVDQLDAHDSPLEHLRAAAFVVLALIYLARHNTVDRAPAVRHFPGPVRIAILQGVRSVLAMRVCRTAGALDSECGALTRALVGIFCECFEFASFRPKIRHKLSMMGMLPTVGPQDPMNNNSDSAYDRV